MDKSFWYLFRTEMELEGEVTSRSFDSVKQIDQFRQPERVLLNFTVQTSDP